MAKKVKKNDSSKKSQSPAPKYPRHTLERALRLPKAVIDQNAGKECTDRELANYLGIKYNGPFSMEIGSAIKYGLLERPNPGKVIPTALAKKIIRPQDKKDELQGYQEAALQPSEFKDVYNHYRGENIPDSQFFENALVDTFKIPQDRVAEFSSIFFDTLKKAELSEEREGKIRVIDIVGSKEDSGGSHKSERIKKLEKQAKPDSNDTCFVIMPFSNPIGQYYAEIYEPAIEKAGIKPIRADAEIFSTGKIMDQILSGIENAKVLVAELTGRNPNVFYELGIAHALGKPVVLVSSNTNDVPFDLQHIRVIYYDVQDPFWGAKLIEKVAENVLSALTNPNEAILKRTII